MKLLMVVVILSVIADTYGTLVQQCPGGKEVKDLSDLVKIGTCTKSPCRLRKGRSVKIEFKFTPDKDIKRLSNRVYANIIGVPFPFIGVDGSDACNNVFEADGTTKSGCPLKAGQEYVYKNNIDVLEIYPRLKLIVHWGLTADDGVDVICFEVPARITN